MKIAEFITIVEQIWRSGSFLPLFCGASGYEADLLYRFPAAVPTDWSYVIEYGIYELYRKTKESDIIELCRQDVEKLLDSKDPFYVWCGYHVCLAMLYNEKDGYAPFQVMDDGMLNKLCSALDSNCEELKAARIWGGAERPDGLWTDITTSSSVLEQEYGIRLLSEMKERAPSLNTPRFHGPVTEDMTGLLGRKLQEYVDALWEEKHRLPRAVRIAGMKIPHVDAEDGCFGNWKPERAHAVASLKTLEKIYGTEISTELYEYYRGWRFAAFELNIGGFLLHMDPLYENSEGQTNFFQSVMLGRDLCFKLGTAVEENTEYTVLYKHNGGVYLLEDGAESVVYFAESITALLENAEKSI